MIKKEFDLVPEFKTAVNSGMVTVAVIEDLKRDIAYLSDILLQESRYNATSMKKVS